MKFKTATNHFIFLFLVLLIGNSFLPSKLLAQNTERKGLYKITNYNYRDYDAAAINWWSCEDDKGLVYFANGNGVLIYDGQHWDLVKPPDGTGARCLIKGKDGKIYVGTGADIGYLAPDKKGSMEFISLKNLIPKEYQDIKTVWQVDSYNDKIYFLTTNTFYVWDYKSFSFLNSKDGFHAAWNIHGKFYCRIWNRGLTVLENDSFHVVPHGDKFTSERIYSLLPYDNKDKLLVGSRSQGLFIYDGKDFTPFKTQADDFIVNTSLYGGIVLPNGQFALNTFNDGVVVIDKNGKIIQRIDKSVGLQDNSVDQLFLDSRGILWMSLFNGLSKMDLSSPFTYYTESAGLPSKAVFHTGMHNGYLYAGTNSGVYVLAPATNRFEKVEGTGGQVGNFIQMGDDFIVACGEKGILKLVGNKSIPIIQKKNYEFHVSAMTKMHADSTVLLVALRGSAAIVKYHPNNKTYTIESIFDNFRARQGIIITDKKDNIWSFGDSRSELKSLTPFYENGKWEFTKNSLKIYGPNNGIPQKGVNQFIYDGDIYFARGPDSVYVYNYQEQKFHIDTGLFFTKYAQRNGNGSTPYSATDYSGRVWANYGAGIFVKIPQADGSLKIINTPFKEISSTFPVWSIMFSKDNDGHQVAWLSSGEGIVRYDGNLDEKKAGNFQALIRTITLNDDSTYFNGFQIPFEKNKFSKKWNSLRFSYAAPFYTEENETVFSTFLEGKDKKWTDWNKQDFRDFGNLPPGNYTFHVKAKNIFDKESKEAVFQFTILPPWYATWWARILFVLIGLGLLMLFMRWRTRKLQEKHKELEKIVTQRTGELKQRAQELEVINGVQEGLSKELDMDSIYQMVGEKIRNVFDAQAVIIATLDEKTGLEHFKYAIEKGEKFSLPPRPYDKLRQHLIKTKKRILINHDYAKARDEFGMKVLPGTEYPKSLVFVPLIIKDEVKSYVSLQNVDKENAFSEADVRLLETLGNSMSVALQNARLFEETKQRTSELGVINSVQEGLVKEMNIQAIYDLVGNRICNLFDTQTVIIRTFDVKQNLEYWQFAIEKGERVYSHPRPIIWANKQLMTTKHSLLINKDYQETARKFGGTGVSKGMPPKSALFVPMIVSGEVRGSVSLQNVEKENAFSESEERLLNTLTNSMSVALENARLFDESNQLLSEAKQRANELSTVNSISQALTSQLNLDDLINLVGEQMKELFHANIVYLAILDHNTNMINFPYQYGDKMQPMKLGEGLTSKIILSGEPLLINKDLDQLREQLGVQQIGVPAASYLGVPIPVENEVIGVLSIQSTETENRFGEDDMRLLTTIAASVGIALKKAKLFEEVKAANHEAEAARKNAEKANEAKSAFLSTVSHELRTPLTSVLGFAKIIKKRLEDKIFPTTDEKDPKLQKTVKQISDNLDVVVSEGQRLTHLINDVLDLAKIEAGKMEWNEETIVVPEIAERAIAATSALFDNNKLKLEKNINTDIPAILGDRDKLIQVMVNLISNAVKFTPEGKVSLSVYEQDQEIHVSVADTGIGIAEADHAAVFEQFKQVGDTLTDKPKGTGLGLPICKEIIEHHGGRIWMESELGKGSIFYFALPITKTISTSSKPIHLEDLVKQLKEQVAHSQLKAQKENARILIVDDDDSIRSLLNQELSEGGYLIEEASNGKEALKRVRDNKPDLIILDIMMPEMNGFDVAAVLKNDPLTMDIPIIVLSIVQDKTRGFRIGVDRYLTKPIDTGLLFNEIGNLLEQGKSKRKVMIVDEDTGTVNTLTEVLKTKGYTVFESDGKELIEKAKTNQPDIIIINSVLSGNQDIVKTLRFEKGLENVLFFVYQ